MSDIVLVSSLFNAVKISEPLGICSLAAICRDAGFDVEILDPAIEGWSPEATAERILSTPSKVLGISILRDEQKVDVLTLVERLRETGDDRFIVIGGHAPTIAITTGEEDNPPPMEGWALPATTTSGPAEEWVPQVVAGRRVVGYRDLGRLCDAVMLGESDLSFPPLVRAVVEGREWREMPGVATLGNDDEFHLGPPAPKPASLDDLPPMARDVLAAYTETFPGRAAASICLGRGCYYRCTFCTVAVFQQIQEGSAHRQRSAGSVVAEIEEIHERFGTTEFNFEDDNFIIKNKRGMEKIHELCDGIQELPFDITFSIFVRADAVDRELFEHLRDAGMTIVYLGLESVHEADLEFFHKGVQLSRIYGALETLRDLGYALEVNDGMRVKLGFIAWHPLTSFASLRDALQFVRRYKLPPKLLRRKLLLYSGIPIKNQIRELGLLAPDTFAGWRYREPGLEHLENAVENYIQQTVSKPYRDRLRTVEKAMNKYDAAGVPQDLAAMQDEMDEMCLAFVDDVLTLAERVPREEVETAIAQLSAQRQEDFRGYVIDRRVDEVIEDGFALARIPLAAVDPFRQ